MKDEEIVYFLKKDDNLMKDIKIAAHLNILEKAIIEKGWITEEKLNELVDKSTELLLEESIKRLNDEQKKTIQEILKLNNFKKGDE
ncbi:MAG: hypothetical protein IJ223_06750 [Clostridia bacterium]|nr:hypothetical protein [Clostridia bacterium]